MNWSLRQLRSFAVLAKAGSFTRAAEALHVSQPALTVQIRTLEEALGVRLFDRNTRQVKLTPIAKELLPAFERVLRDIDSVAVSARELAAGIRGVVHVAALPSICSTLLPAVIAQVRSRYPGIVVRLRDAVAQRVLSLVRTEDVDLGIGGFDRVDADMTVSPLFSDRLVAVVPEGHALARKKLLSLKDLAGSPLIFMDTQSSVRALVEEAFFETGTVPNPAYEVTYMTTALGLVQARQGVTFIPSSALELNMLSGVQVRPFAGAALERRIGIVSRKGRTPSPAAEGFLEILKSYARSLPPASRSARAPTPPRGAPPGSRSRPARRPR